MKRVILFKVDVPAPIKVKNGSKQGFVLHLTLFGIPFPLFFIMHSMMMAHITPLMAFSCTPAQSEDYSTLQDYTSKQNLATS